MLLLNISCTIAVTTTLYCCSYRYWYFGVFWCCCRYCQYFYWWSCHCYWYYYCQHIFCCCSTLVWVPVELVVWELESLYGGIAVKQQIPVILHFYSTIWCCHLNVNIVIMIVASTHIGVGDTHTSVTESLLCCWYWCTEVAVTADEISSIIELFSWRIMTLLLFCLNQPL